MVNARRQPVVPAWIRDDVTRRTAAKFAVLHVSHLAAFHTARLPKYAARTAWHAPRGLWRFTGAVAGWVFDAEAAPLRAEAVARGDHKAYAKLDELRAAKIRYRGITFCSLALGLLISVLVADAYWAFAWIPAALVGVVTLGYMGRPLDRVWLDVPLEETVRQPLTADVVVRALTSLGLAAMSKPESITFAHPVTRDGPGWRADVNLPFGVTVADVIDRRERLASGLRRPLGAVWPEPDHSEHAGRLVLWVGYRAMSKARQPDWPLLRSGTHSMFHPVPFGTDQRGRNTGIRLMYSNLLTGGLPGSGKTMATRVTLLAGALDPQCEQHVWDLSGKGDLAALEQTAHRYGCGLDEQTLANCVLDLREAYGELERRAKVLAGLPRDLVPENKVTPDVAARRTLGLHPYQFAVAECQELFGHPEFGKVAAELAAGFIKRGRALGMILLLDTQRPDAGSLPPAITANAGTRFCLRVMDDRANNMVLGAGAYAAGYRATSFTPDDKGIGFLVGAEPVPIVVRSYYIDAVQADKVAARGRAVREAAGLLTGYAAGDVGAELPAVSLLADVASAIGPEDRMWSETICARLAELRPELYGGWSADQLARALAPYGIETGQQWASGKNRRGVEAAAVRAAMAARNGHASR